MEAKDIERFWSKVNKSDGCWMWTTGKNRSGYGMFKANKKMFISSRLSYQLQNGEIPKGMFVCHKCDNPSCVNPDYLFLGTPQDNVDDMIAKGRQAIRLGTKKSVRKTHCKRGHELTSENTYTHPKYPNGRQCKVCQNIRIKALLAKKRDLVKPDRFRRPNRPSTNKKPTAENA